MPSITFETRLLAIGSWTIVRLPEGASKKLPSRGQVMAEGTINGYAFKTPLEPDGKGSHWFSVDKGLLRTSSLKAGDKVSLTLEPSKSWPEPTVPPDLEHALATDSKASALWKDITPMARWEWIRWTRATNNTETRKRRIEVGLSKMKAGERRPCCWNRNLCTEPTISKNGVLLDTA